MIDDISDHRYAGMLRRYLNQQTPDVKEKLKNIRLCGSQVIHQMGMLPAVFIVANHEHAHFFGNTACHSSWACPVCTARTMAKHGANIAAAIDALSKWYNQKAVMVTFTLPHIKSMPCKQTFKLLRDTWRKFAKENRTEFTSTQTYQTKSGVKQHTGKHHNQNSALAHLREDLGIQFFVKAFEFTWGDNGWHPHIHALFWVPAKNFTSVVDYEEFLNQHWISCLRSCAKKFMDKDFVEELLADWKFNHNSVTISKNPDGTPRQQMSSHYISGWGGDLEVSGNVGNKATHNGHLTPYQMLVEAWNNPDQRDFWLGLYVEYALATVGHRRIAKTPKLGAIITKWKSSQQWIETLKKKCMEKGYVQQHPICWFKQHEWFQICILEQTNISIKGDLLQLATLPDGRRRIKSLLDAYDIHISDEPHPNQSFLENKLFKMPA